MSTINVVMIGASRSGKTSILASMLGNMKNQEIAQHFIFRENNALEYNNLSNKEKEDIRLLDIICSMKDLVNPNIAGKSVPKMASLFGTDAMFTYKFKLESRTQSNNELEIHFTDVPGENCVNTAIAYDEYISKVKDSQILVVSVDVPSMMYAKLHHKAKLNVGMNLPDEVNEAVQKLGMNFNDPNLFKMVVFVPIKCEYWAHNNQMDEVYAEIKEIYENAIATIKHYSNIRSFILPVETIGGCEFDHHSEGKDSFILLSDKSEIENLKQEDFINDKSAFRCEKLGNNRVRLKNGEVYECSSDDELISTSERPFHPYFLSEVGVQIPYAWYIRKDDIGYQPKNCEQLLLHVLKFSIEAMIKRNWENITFRDIIRIIRTLDFRLNSIKLSDFSEKIRDMIADGILREVPNEGVLIDNIQ